MTDTANNAGKVFGDMIDARAISVPQVIYEKWWILALIAAFIVFYFLLKKRKR